MLIIFLFGIGPIGYIQVQNSKFKAKYELEQAHGMFPEEPYRTDIAAHYNRNIVFYWIIAVLGPVSALLLASRKK